MNSNSLRPLIREMLLIERSTLPPGVDLYHRSGKTFKVGDIIDGSYASKSRNASIAEIALEMIRKSEIEKSWQNDWRSKNPPKGRGKKRVEIPAPPVPDDFDTGPSRLTSVFASLVPRSRFMNYGKLYRVKIVGDVYKIANSRIIDEIHNKSYQASNDYSDYDKDGRIQGVMWAISHLAHRYFEQDVKITKYNLDDIEIYAPKMQVVEVIEEEGKVIAGNKYVTDSPITVEVPYAPNENDSRKLEEEGFKISPGSYKTILTIPAGTVINFASITKRDNKKDFEYNFALKMMVISFDNVPDYYARIYSSDDATKLYKLARSGKLKQVK